jgi:hypothetical protein
MGFLSEAWTVNFSGKWPMISALFGREQTSVAHVNQSEIYRLKLRLENIWNGIRR